jgi:hypothetical protein
VTKASEEPVVARKRGGQARQVENEDSDEDEEDEERLDDPDWEDESEVLDDEEQGADKVRIICTPRLGAFVEQKTNARGLRGCKKSKEGENFYSSKMNFVSKVFLN